MRGGKDVATDKPGCTTRGASLPSCAGWSAETGRIWSVNYSERFEVAAVTRALELVRAGAIGRVVQTVLLGAAPAEPAPAAGLVLPAGKLRRHPGAISAATRSSSSSPSPARRTPRSSPLRSATSPTPAIPTSPISARCCCAARTGRGYIRARLVHAGRAGQLGRRAADRPRHRRLHGTAQIRRHRRPAGHQPPVPGGQQSTRYIDCSDAGLPYYPEPGRRHARPHRDARCRRRIASR